jgi:hypothetical protein
MPPGSLLQRDGVSCGKVQKGTLALAFMSPTIANVAVHSSASTKTVCWGFTPRILLTVLLFTEPNFLEEPC